MAFQIKRAAALAAAAILVSSLAACGSKEDAVPASTTPAETTITEAASLIESTTEQDLTVEQTEPTQNLAYRAVYAKELSALRAKYGTPNKDDQEPSGVVFADLLDWDQDGVPELFTMVKEDGENQYGRERFRLIVSGEKDGEAVTLLDSALGSGYANLGSLLYFCLTRNSSGNILVFVEDSHEYENLKETFYSLSDGKVTSTVLSGQSSVGGWEIDPETGEDRPAHLDAYQIDGKPSDAAAYEAKIKEFGMDDCLGVWCQDRYDMDTLDAFLTGQTDVYPGGALMETATHPQGGDGMPASWWADEVLYTVGE